MAEQSPSTPAYPSFLRRMLRPTTQRIAWAILAGFVLLAVAAPLVAPFDPNAQDLRHTLQPPGGDHLLGTDAFGRDLLSRLIFGLRSSMLISLITTAAVAAIGLPVGLLAGYARGLANTIIARIIDIGLALPSLVLALALIAALGAGMRSTIIALATGYSPYLARVVRSIVLQLRQEEYVDSARVSNVPVLLIAVRHVIPNTVSVVSVQLTLIFCLAIIGEAGLSFVGLGVQQPTASLGNLLADGSSHSLELPVLAVAPGVVIAMLVITLLFAGDGLREALEPRERR